MSGIIKDALSENVLTALVYNEECAAQLLLLITPEMFEDAGKQIVARRAIEYLRKYNRPPGRHLRDLFDTELRGRDAVATAIQGTFMFMDSISGHLQPRYVLDQLQTFIETARIRKVLLDAKLALDTGDVEGAKLALTDKEVQPSFGHGTWLHKPEEMLRFLNTADDDLFSSGIDELDIRGVRPSRKTLMVLVAPPKAGKSWYLINQAKKNLIRRKSVLHMTCENSEELTSKRYIQSLYAMSTYPLENIRLPFFDRINGGGVSYRSATLEEEKARLGQIESSQSYSPTVINESQRIPLTTRLRDMESRPRLLIKEFASGQLTIPMIIAFMDMLERTEGFVPDLLIIDYPKQMKISMREYRLDLGRIVIELRGIAVARNIAVTTVMQGSKIAKSAHVVTSGMTAEDYSVVGTADTIITYSQTPEEKKIGLARILVDAARDTPDSYLVMISQSYAIGQFALDSVYMSQHLESDVAQHMGAPAKQDNVHADDDEAEPTL